MNFQQFNLLNQIVHVMESVRRDIRKNAEYSQLQLGIMPLQTIIDVHMRDNAAAYTRTLDRVQLAYNKIGTPDEIVAAMDTISLSAAEGLSAYAELRAAVDLILTSALVTEADVSAACDDILLTTGAAYVTPNDSIL